MLFSSPDRLRPLQEVPLGRGAKVARTGNPKTPKLVWFQSFWMSVGSPLTKLDEGARPRNPKTPKPHEVRSFWISVRAALAQHTGGTTCMWDKGGPDWKFKNSGIQVVGIQ